MSILPSHAASWHSDKWYRRAWYIWPQAISLLFVGWFFAGALLKPIPWAEPKTQAPPTTKDGPQAQPTTPRSPPSPQPNTDVTICSQGSSHDALAACSRLIDKGVVGVYFSRAQIYFRNGDYDRAIADFSAFIRLNPNSVAAFNERGLSYAKKGDYDRAIADYSEAIRLDRGSVLPYSNRGSAYEKKGELDKALADFREALRHGSTTATEDVNRVEQAIRSLSSKYVVNGFGGLGLGTRVSFDTSDYREYQCTPSEQFEGLTWCNKQRFEKDPRGLYRSSYTILHSRDGTIYYLNRALEPAFSNPGEVDNDIERLSRKFGEQPRRIGMPRGQAPVDGLMAVWGKVTLEPLDPTGINELAGGRSPRKGILIDFIGNLSDSARRGLPIYRVSGGPGFVWAASFNPKGRGALRFFAIDPSALLPVTAKESTMPAPTTYANPQNDCDGLAANPSDRRKPPSVPGVPYDSLMNQAKQAIAACTAAIRQNPNELRYQYQMARAMEAEAPEKALEIHKKLADQGYPVAYDNLGWLMVKLYKNYGAAITYFKIGSQLRDPDSMVSLVEMIDKGYVSSDRPYELKYQLLRTAADLGHQGAQVQIREEEENLSAAQRQAVQDLQIIKDFLGIR
jgi:tetratricopeptide (TPR) repeat protein